MTPAARIGAAIDLIDRIQAGELADGALADWGRKNRYAGSKDRAAIGDIVYDVLRKRQSFALLGGGETGRALLLGYVRASGKDPKSVFGADRYAPRELSNDELSSDQLAQVKLSEVSDFPDWLWPYLVRSHGDRALSIARALRDRAPVHLRVNLQKLSRDTAIASLAEEGVETEPLGLSPSALQVVEGARRIRNSISYQNGIVELQDASSQAVADLVPLGQGETLLDFCAGAGGKVLAIAGRTTGIFFAHDIEKHRMKDLPKRAKRADVRVSRITLEEIDDVQQRFDTVLVDAPCSGSGSWRRDPQGKWLLTPDKLDRILTSQKEILDRAAQLVKPGGHLVYSTCSLLDCENELQMKEFLTRSVDFSTIVEQHFSPLSESDGFYCSVLRKD
ncbi:RsmB/NOP family class I SAM-dependent RNA methyltransferase [Cognatiyoonia sp. IB215446]|uniref:RsmB/NOP family class I SAM-dependent RNA methyltransferase n=1 Tax=Cognatiyoonia sp. IB215446 TaxID=3097355 RepID=UPI002A166D06|nr:RsmB/NOP family class I SAM-dependent RNA methyltransferase [Cognatiyoonia sp. IB215446]MDX8348803.1 RsmB/NOP family class I SAM-dependent RNA methyltransferase [Cognatiyoonia sp. IB215446]